MLRTSLIAFAMVASLPALAQESDFQPCSEILDAGTYVVATGQWFPPGTLGGPKATQGVIYNNTCSTGFFASFLSGSVLIDEGRIPSPSSPAPNAGTRQSHRVNEFQIGYCTRELDPSLSGPGAQVRVRFFQDYDDCADLATAGVPEADYLLTGLPASSAVGALSCYTLTVDLTGLEFCLVADSEGTFDNVATLDGFGYALQMPGQTGTTTATSGGFIIAGAPTTCLVGDGTYYKNPGLANGTGLDNNDLYFRQGSGTQTTGCLFFGGTPWAGFHMRLSADLDDCSCTPNDADGDCVTDCEDVVPNGPDFDADGDGVADCTDNCPLPNPGQEDCDGDGVGDLCSIVSSYSVDTDLNGTPDNCEPGVGTPYCFGDGTDTPCPCGNEDVPGSGCKNSTGNGALCYSFGGASVSAHDTAIFTVRAPTNVIGLYVMGSVQLNGGLGFPAFDGLVCTGGMTRRFPAQFTGTTGVMDLLDPATVFPAEIVPASTWNFAAWMRDPLDGPCSTGANFSNALQITFLP